VNELENTKAKCVRQQQRTNSINIHCAEEKVIESLPVV